MPYLRTGPLVRATSATSVVIWAEFSEPCSVQLRVTAQGAEKNEVVEKSTTTRVGGRYYIATPVQGLRPSTWYTYTLASTTNNEHILPQDDMPLLQCFRTFDTADEVTEKRELRLAYGSCRRAERDGTDVLSAFGRWLVQHAEQKEQIWPHLLLLIGDQIYADAPPREVVQSYPHIGGQAKTFEDFCTLYQHAWTYDAEARQALAVIPTYMVFDDHEVTNNWNFEPQWRSRALREGKEQILVDGVVAYWIYQGWGNVLPDEAGKHPLCRMMQDAARNGEDVLESLQACIRDDMYARSPLKWHYSIPTAPPMFVINARSERTSLLTEGRSSGKAEVEYNPTRIVGQGQMEELGIWLGQRQEDVVLLVSSVPVLLPPLIGMCEYLTGKRFWKQGGRPLYWLGRQFSRVQQAFANRASFDHWPRYEDTWEELMGFLRKRQKQVLFLSGDVHFSYALEAVFVESTRPDRKGNNEAGGVLYQLVSTPLQNVLDRSDEVMIKLQAAVKRMTYGGIRARVLPLHSGEMQTHVYKDLLFENTLAFVTCCTQGSGTYRVRQQYMGSGQGEFKRIASTEDITM